MDPSRLGGLRAKGYSLAYNFKDNTSAEGRKWSCHIVLSDVLLLANSPIGHLQKDEEDRELAVCVKRRTRP